MTMTRRMMGAMTLASGVACTVRSAWSQAWPSRPVRLLVGFAPGGTIDVVARIVGEQLSSTLGQPFVVENKAGANGMIAAELAARAEPDGYTVFFSNSSTITLNPTLMRGLKYDPTTDFAPVTTVVSVPLILVVNPEMPEAASIRSVADLIALARQPQARVNYGSAGQGNITQLAFELLSSRAGIQMTHVPYRGAAAAQAALLGKEILTVFDTLAAVPLVKSGRLRALATSSTERLPALPDVPTLAESGFPGFDISFWVGVFVPKATPAALVDRLAAAIEAATRVPAVRDRLLSQGTILTLSPARFAAKIEAETKELAAIAAKANIRLD